MSALTTQNAYEINGQRVSPAAFYIVACDPRRSVAVEACAGAGKTWMLVSRMLRALLDGAAPQDILAITFTKKAAGEMRERLYHWLADFAGKDDAALAQELRIRGVAAPDAAQVAALRGLQRRLLAQGRSVQVRTFHSWFAALLQSAPWAALRELGLPASFELLENDAEAVAKVWRVFLASVQADDALRQDYLASVQAVGRFNTHKALEKALEKRVEFQLADAAGTLEPSVQPVGAVFAAYAGLPDPQQRLQTPAAQALLWQAARVLGASTLKSMSERGAALEQALTAQDWPGVVDALMTQKGEPRKLNDKVVGVEEARAAQALLSEHAQALHQHQCWQHHQRMVRLTRQMVQDFSDLKRERGWIDMGDLERTALALLSDPVLGAWVQERLDAQVRHLLIDEFQDTNPLQWQALHAWLESYGGAGSAPCVFIVGDPKQSIYRFRRAEPQVFRAAQRFVREGLGGDLLSCDHTRRNAPEVIAAVNASMAQAQAAGQMPGFRTHTTDSSARGAVLALPPIPRGPASSASEGDPAQAPVAQWRDSLTTPRETVEESRKRQECAQVLRWLTPQLRSGELQPHEVMVLARRRSTLGVMQELLSAAGVPSVQPEKTDLSESPTVQDVTALLDALVSPWHDLSTARALKSPLLGLDDADLVELALQVRARTAAAPEDLSARHWLPCLWALAASEAPEARLERLALAGRTLQRWQGWVAERNVHAALAAILDDANARERYAASVPAALRETVLADLHAVQQAALAVDGGRFLSAYALVRALRRPGQQAPLRADSQALRLLTVHGAKGLEAKLVILLDTDGEAARKDSMGVLLDWPGEAAHPQRFAFLLGESRPSQCLQQAMEAELREREREEVNGLYVALTRAQRSLLLSSVAPRTANPASWWARLQGLVTPVQAGDEALQAVEVQAGEFAWSYIEKWAVDPVEIAQSATKSVATANAVSLEAESLESRMGQAMHRLLEWVAPRPGGVAAGTMPWSDSRQRSVQESFALEDSQMASVLRAATGILCGQGAWVWDAAALSWQGSEVPLVAQGRLLRLDRLVQHRDSGAWWVLDYKSTATPLQQPELCAQLAQYRAAVGLAYPGANVRAAFLTPDGQLQEWRADAAQ
ncbi:UvrD-helicase domain-containing protein [Curvibacter sp. APW13]|uniref:UvrD-helicase domain-containing protein n=1 Tax=Curvibacter sp. APW13 TaxID=3077236 RepID=UPI0028DD8884|nr:UvrD-helicase domain-containing protein [Curvibacter sp. APW13]MDT8992217.1 UvrD-helicase domain-containing protein [Curvibacter sp. APW13]